MALALKLVPAKEVKTRRRGGRVRVRMRVCVCYEGARKEEGEEGQTDSPSKKSYLGEDYSGCVSQRETLLHI